MVDQVERVTAGRAKRSRDGGVAPAASWILSLSPLHRPCRPLSTWPVSPNFLCARGFERTHGGGASVCLLRIGVLARAGAVRVTSACQEIWRMTAGDEAVRSQLGGERDQAAVCPG